MIEATIHSRWLGNRRRLWVQPATGGAARAVCVLLDGEYYVGRMGAPAFLAECQSAGVLPPIDFVYVSHVDGTTRWEESFCNARFVRFLGDELVPWVGRHPDLGGVAGRPLLGGLSLTGMAAAHAALVRPSAFSGVLCQSASFWWSEGRLVEEVRRRAFGGHPPQRFRLVCGTQETKSYVEHGPGLVQRRSQLDSNRDMRDALQEAGHAVSYEEYMGGHDVEAWRRDLPGSLSVLLAAFESDDGGSEAQALEEFP